MQVDGQASQYEECTGKPLTVARVKAWVTDPLNCAPPIAKEVVLFLLDELLRAPERPQPEPFVGPKQKICGGAPCNGHIEGKDGCGVDCVLNYNF